PKQDEDRSRSLFSGTRAPIWTDDPAVRSAPGGDGGVFMRWRLPCDDAVGVCPGRRSAWHSGRYCSGALERTVDRCCRSLRVLSSACWRCPAWSTRRWWLFRCWWAASPLRILRICSGRGAREEVLTWGEDVEAHALRKWGWSISAIARHLGRNRRTIRAYLNGEREPGR